MDVNRNSKLCVTVWSASSPEVLYELILLHVLSASHVTELLHIRLEEILLVGAEPLQEGLGLCRVAVKDQLQVHVDEHREQKLAQLVLWGQSGAVRPSKLQGKSWGKMGSTTTAYLQCCSLEIIFGMTGKQYARHQFSKYKRSQKC